MKSEKMMKKILLILLVLLFSSSVFSADQNLDEKNSILMPIMIISFVLRIKV
jgi:uncharacterized membrane protein YadS